MSLRHRLLLAEDDFLDALQQGGDSVDAFDKRWASLLADVQLAEERGDLDTETLELAHATALRLSILIETSVDVLAIHDNITSDLMSQLDDLMSDLSLSDSISLPQPSPRRTSSSSPGKWTSHAPEVVAPSRKRPRSSNDSEHISTSLSKKRCTTNGQSPSPKSSSPSSHLVSLFSVPNHTGLEAAPQQGGRKRCLSDTETTFPPPSKRMYAGPRLHAVSDSYSPAASLHPPHVPAKGLDNVPMHSPRPDTPWMLLDSSTLFDIQPYIVPTDEMFTFQSSDTPDLGTLWSMLHPSMDIPGCNDVHALLCSLGDLSSVPQLTDSIQVTPTNSTPSTPSSVSTSISPITPSLDACLDDSTILDPDSFSLDSYPPYETFLTIDPAIPLTPKLLAQPEGADVHSPLSKRYDNQLVEDRQPALDPLFWLAASLPDCSQPNVASDGPDVSVLIPARTFVTADCIGLMASSPVQSV